MSQQQKSQYEDIILAIIVVGLIVAIAVIIWHYFHAELTNALRWVRVSEMWLASYIVKSEYTIMVPDIGEQSLSVWRNWLPRADVSVIDYAAIRASTYVAVVPLKIFFAGVLGLMMLWAIMSGPGTQYRRRMNLDGLMAEQAKSFPAIAPFLKFNPRSAGYRVLGQPVPKKLPMFAEALSPEEWLAYHEIRVQNNQLDINATWQALGQQLGRRWAGPTKLPIHAQALYAACALRYVRKRKESEALMNELSQSWTPDRGLRVSMKLRSRIASIVRDPKLGGALKKYTDQHAFETTAMLRVLQRAREEGGVMAPASFLWLRGVDRNLWYPLNNLGRKSYHAEAVGALVHYTNELIAGQKIPAPRFEDVIRGLETFLKGPMSRAIPPLDKEMKKKKK